MELFQHIEAPEINVQQCIKALQAQYNAKIQAQRPSVSPRASPIPPRLVEIYAGELVRSMLLLENRLQFLRTPVDARGAGRVANERRVIVRTRPRSLAVKACVRNVQCRLGGLAGRHEGCRMHMFTMKHAYSTDRGLICAHQHVSLDGIKCTSKSSFSYIAPSPMRGPWPVSGPLLRLQSFFMMQKLIIAYTSASSAHQLLF